MNLNRVIQPERESVTEIIQNLRTEKYFVDHSFQRRLVWTEKEKARLIESVLTGYPMPEIYIWEQPPNSDTGTQHFSIVDGQQRLTALNQFISNEWALKSNHLHEENRRQEFSNKYWRDLSSREKNLIWEYKINVRKIPSDVDIDEIRKIFVRLNETDRSLNPQELRNAEFNGKFIQAAALLAEDPKLTDLNIFTINDIRRMRDVEFASQLLGYERRGIAEDNPNNLNRMFDQFNDDYPSKDEDVASVIRTFDVLTLLFETPEIRDLFGTQNNIYSLHALMSSETNRYNIEQWRIALAAFASQYEKDNTDDPYISDFREGSRSRTRSRSSRLQRHSGLQGWIMRFLETGVE